MKKILILLSFFSISTQAKTRSLLQDQLIFLQTCHVIGEDDYVTSSIEITNEFKVGSHFNLKLIAYEDKNCETPYLQYNQYFQMRDFQGHNLNLRTNKITYTAFTNEVTDALNMINYCGFTSWQVGEEKIVTGKVCDDFQQLEVGQTLYQILKFNSVEKVQFGKIQGLQNGRSEKQRPTQFDLEFTKILAEPGLNIYRIPL